MKNWIVVELKDIAAKITDGSHNPPPKQSSGLPMLSATNILDDKIVFDNYRLIDPEAFKKEYQRANVEYNDVLLTIVGTIGRSCVVPSRIDKFTLQRSVALIKPIIVDSKFLSFALRAPHSQSFFEKESKGTAQKGIYLNSLRKLRITIPPLPEQRAIVAKIEQLFSELDNGIANLKTALEQLKVYRQAVLKKAFEGELTKAWRAKQKNLPTAEELLDQIRVEREKTAKAQGKKAKEPSSLSKDELSELPALPAEWGWATYEQLCSLIRNGISTKPDGTETDAKIFRISAVRPMKFDLEDYRHLNNSSGRFNDYYLEKGDLVFTRYNGSRKFVGVCAEFSSDDKFLFPDKLVQTKLISTKITLPSFFEKAINTHISRSFIESRIRTTAGQSGISGSDIKAMPVIICSTAEQHQIVQEIESRLSVCDKVEETIKDSLVKAEALRQSILKKAFEGKLLTEQELQICRQQPDWEPAEKLLERIKKEGGKAASKSKKAQTAEVL